MLVEMGGIVHPRHQPVLSIIGKICTASVVTLSSRLIRFRPSPFRLLLGPVQLGAKPIPHGTPESYLFS
jgi:hypothetical protein